MQRIKINSTVIASVVYDDGTLFVEFFGNGWYKYVHVPEKIFEQFLNAPSKGQFFNRFIKPVYRNVAMTNQELEMVCRIAL